ncbi:WD REPEATS REGION domain-containing protein [Citrus sinensis]|uniref:WD REPEATS REGION domain-containing protein n=1 Tax=Citrus sinensis TaxID=2711 RepID=A0ACB8NBB1_CITSI|nr:WD REPEATS REGION domain-containing protein [Citrus sinensis]
MPQELPGFYYDAEKNRYFPIKGPIPGTSRSSSTAAQKPISKQPTRATNSSLTGATTSKLLQARELRGNVFSLSKGKCNFKEEFQKRLISQPVVWRYEATNQTGDITLEQIELNVQTPEGQFRTDVLLTGSVNGFFSLFEVGNVGQHAHDTVKFIPSCVWPRIKDNKTESSKAPEHIWRLNKASILMPSSVSCIKLFGKHPSCATDGGSVRHALNGAIVTVDVRKRQRGCSSRAGRRHRIPYSRLQRNDRVTNEQWFELKANIWPSHTTFMPSSISWSFHIINTSLLAGCPVAPWRTSLQQPVLALPPYPQSVLAEVKEMVYVRQ